MSTALVFGRFICAANMGSLGSASLGSNIVLELIPAGTDTTVNVIMGSTTNGVKTYQTSTLTSANSPLNIPPAQGASYVEFTFEQPANYNGQAVHIGIWD